MENEEQMAFYETIEATTTELVSTTRGVQSLESLVTIIRCLGKTNKKAVKVLKIWKEEILNNKELFELLVGFYECNDKIVEFLNAVEEWLNERSGIQWRLEQVRVAIKGFKSWKLRSNIKVRRGSAILEEKMGEFMEATKGNNNATEKMYDKLNEVMADQQRLRERLHRLNPETQHAISMERLEVFRKISTVILATVYVGLLVCAAVVAVLTPALVIPPLAAIAAIASMNPTEHFGRMMNHIWDKYEKRLVERAEQMKSTISRRSRMTMADLEDIRGVIDELQKKIKGFSLDEAGVVNDPVVKSMVKDVKKKIDEFGRVVKDLQKVKDKCYNKVIAARIEMIGMTN